MILDLCTFVLQRLRSFDVGKSLREYEGVGPHCAGGEEVHLEACCLYHRQRHGDHKDPEEEERANFAQNQHACLSINALI